MRGIKAFKAHIQRTVAGRIRWSVEIRTSGETLGSGYTRTVSEARTQARQIQENNLHRFGHETHRRG